MTLEELKEEVNIELESIEKVVQELSDLLGDTGNREPTVREKTAAATFLSQFYTGIENILKRISRLHSIDLPTGETWHIELFKRFCDPPFKTLPLLFDDELASALAPYRKFRHVVHHGYAFQLDWDRMKEGIASIAHVFARFQTKLNDYLESPDMNV